MQIDWITVTAQIFNFLVLVYLLKRFLYAPVMDAMAERERGIAGRLREAEERELAAVQEGQAYRDESSRLDEQRESLLAEAREEAKRARAKMLDALRAEIAETRNQWRKEVDHEKAAFLRDVRTEIGKQVTLVAARAVKDLAGTGLEQQMIRRLLEQLRSMDPDEKQALVDACNMPECELLVSTGFDLSERQRVELQDQLSEAVGEAIRPRFATAPDLICGIALEAPASKWLWSVDSYLEGLEEKIGQALAHSRGEFDGDLGSGDA